MRRTLYLRLAILPVLLLGALLYSQGAKAVSPATSPVTRTDPVIVSAPALPNLYNAPVNQLFVFAFNNGTWTQIPSQVDERTNIGQLVATGDGTFNCGTNTPPPCGSGNSGDEIVFMAKDLGQSSNGAGPRINGALVSTQWYQVTVTDPTNGGVQGYAYIAQSSTLTPLTTGYVTYDANSHQIHGQTYTMGYNPGNNYFSYLTLSDPTNVLDRTPKIYTCAVLCFNEESNLLKGQGLQLIKAGPVRVTIRGGSNTLTNELLGYGWNATGTERVQAPIVPSFIRQTTDWTAQVQPATIYNAAVPGGVTVDGVQDNVPATPYSPWWEMSSSHGSVVFAGNPAPAGGTPTNYYFDSTGPDNTPKATSTDPTSYGNVGSVVTSPNGTFTYPFTFYFLPPTQPSSAGTTYYNYFQNPLTQAAQAQLIVLPPRVWLPYVTK